MLFRKKKQDARVSPRTLKVLLLLLLANMLYISFWGDSSNGVNAPMVCDAGPLSPMVLCQENRSLANESIAWWHSDARGALDKNVCRQMSLEEETIAVTIARDNSTDRIIRTSCKAIGLTEDNFCYASQHLSTDGAKRHVSILTTNANCGDARYFRGVNASHHGGKIHIGLKSSEKITGISELKE